MRTALRTVDGHGFVSCAFKIGSSHPARSSIGRDFLLTNKQVESAKRDTIMFVRTGTHAELFD